MTPAEIPHRVVRTLAAHAERIGLRDRSGSPPPDVSNEPRPWISANVGVNAARYFEAADRIVAGKLDVFALRDVDLGSPPRWNRDPKTGVEAPLRFGKLLDYRDPHLVGDIKYLWEPNRHLHVVTLAQAYALSRRSCYLATLREHIESWITACPYRMGANWASALEPAIRLINWSIAWQLLGGASSDVWSSQEGERLRGRWLASVHEHARFVIGNLSLYSSANNHLVGEVTGLFIAALTFPYWPETSRWLTASKTILEREALLQNGPDGVNREQAVAYHQFEADLLLLAVLAGRANSVVLAASVLERLERMLEYIASIMDVRGNVPMFGDSDDGFVVRVSQEPHFCRFQSLLASGSLLFGRGDFKAKARWLDDKTRWLFGACADTAFQQLAARPAVPMRRAFQDAGYYVLGCDFETPSEIKLVADAGPLGYQKIAAHGHADALAFTLSVGGREILVDAGTYTYLPNSWRAYFRGTTAHSTVRVDALDQSEPGGNFMWLNRANAACRQWYAGPEMDVIEGSHDGYTRLPDPVVHRRRITLHKRARFIEIEDALEMTGAHDIELFFHLSEQCHAVAQQLGYLLVHDDIRARIELPQLSGSSVSVHSGELTPPLGWVSRRFDQKRPSPTIVWRARLRGPSVLRTTIHC